jgi:alpha-ribazole phosphatase
MLRAVGFFVAGESLVSRLWLIRHGEPAEHARQRCYGDLDIGLSDKGRMQMAQAVASLQEESIAAVYSSPRSRALESARMLAKGCPLIPVDDFCEINFGDFEGRTYDEIARSYPELFRQWMTTPTQVRFPNGESFSEMRARVLAAFHELRRAHEGQTIAIVSHGGVNRAILSWALRMPDEALFRIAQDYAAQNLLRFVEDVPVVELINRHPDL